MQLVSRRGHQSIKKRTQRTRGKKSKGSVELKPKPVRRTNGEIEGGPEVASNEDGVQRQAQRDGRSDTNQLVRKMAQRGGHT